LRPTRPISWLAPARKAFEAFPEGEREITVDALSIAAEGEKAGIGSGVFEIALAYRGNALRIVYAEQLGEELWVVHAVQKKSTKGIKASRRDMDLIKDRLKRLKEMLR
jgi:phage-related protein